MNGAVGEIEIQITKDGVLVRGKLVSLARHRVEVETIAPIAGARLASGHIMAMVKDRFAYEDAGTLTEQGRERAQHLLLELYRANEVVEEELLGILAALRRTKGNAPSDLLEDEYGTRWDEQGTSVWAVLAVLRARGVPEAAENANG